ncbi:DNA-formamidopyrimidine glycosylase [Ureaplasma canigenitalium]|uniref:DNA-formamidopyrimidine glycosylase n=1 Tax=Ureaplasma canigenitalium TaxID=42092 RepID=UPI0004E21C82|nr:DNA-formamidopyrimidine glycosylase [Ureaplasma canigenitalium]
MPEFPEVYTIIEHLKDNVLNQTISHAEVRLNKLIKNKESSSFVKMMIGLSFRKITQKGKYLIFHLSNENFLVVHLRMEGKFFYYPSCNAYVENKHNHIRFYFENGSILVYNDTRQFGTFHLFTSNEFNQSPMLKKIAPDPFDSKFTPSYLKDQLKHKKGKIKNILLDQSIVSGLGNIYVDEVLFYSKIHPNSIASKLTDDDLKKIVKYSKEILNASILNKGTTIHSYMFNTTDTGGFQNFLKVHTKKDHDCPNCGYKIIKIKVNNRGTYLCPKCQKEII